MSQKEEIARLQAAVKFAKNNLEDEKKKIGSAVKSKEITQAEANELYKELKTKESELKDIEGKLLKALTTPVSGNTPISFSFAGLKITLPNAGKIIGGLATVLGAVIIGNQIVKHGKSVHDILYPPQKPKPNLAPLPPVSNYAQLAEKVHERDVTMTEVNPDLGSLPREMTIAPIQSVVTTTSLSIPQQFQNPILTYQEIDPSLGELPRDTFISPKQQDEEMIDPTPESSKFYLPTQGYKPPPTPNDELYTRIVQGQKQEAIRLANLEKEERKERIEQYQQNTTNTKRTELEAEEEPESKSQKLNPPSFAPRKPKVSDYIRHSFTNVFRAPNQTFESYNEFNPLIIPPSYMPGYVSTEQIYPPPVEETVVNPTNSIVMNPNIRPRDESDYQYEENVSKIPRLDLSQVSPLVSQ